jgi:PAS domain S-box-containing protein
MDITDRKQESEKLLQSEARYKAILDAIPDLMFRINRDGKYLDFKGEGANATTEYEQIVGKNLRDLLPEDVAAKSLEAIAKTLDSKTLQTCEYQLPTESGMRDYEARLVVCGEDEVLAIVRDITEKNKSEVSLRSLADKFSKAFNCSPNSITISTLKEGRFIEVNDSFVRLSGYTRSEAIGRTAIELGIWVNQSDRTRLLQELQLNGVVRNLEFEFRKKSGEVAIGMVSAEIIDLDGCQCLLAVDRDITERKHSEELLRLGAQRDRLLTETLARIRNSLKLEEILQTTVIEVRQFLQADRVFIGLNHDLLGAKILAESVEPNYPSILDCKIQEDPTVLAEFKKLLTTHRVRVVEDITQMEAPAKIKAHYQQFQTRASLAVPIILGEELFGALIANQCGSARHWQPMEIDLLIQLSQQLAIAIQQAQLYQELAKLNTNLEDQVKERTAQLQQKMQELQELHQVKDVVLHTISHELKTSVMGTLMVLKNLLNEQVVKKDKPDREISFPLSPDSIPVPRKIIERMIQGNECQLSRIYSLVELHTSVSEGVALNKRSVKFNAVLNKSIKDLEPVLTQNQATLVNLVPEDLPDITADPAQLQRVLVNLIIHSLQQNPPGLKLTLNATVERGTIQVQIQDNGVGMSQLECDRLFDLYVRNPQAGFSTGNGLKLYLCRQIIEAHGGGIGALCKPKRGLKFWFTLPRTYPQDTE